MGCGSSRACGLHGPICPPPALGGCVEKENAVWPGTADALLSPQVPPAGLPRVLHQVGHLNLAPLLPHRQPAFLE